MHPRTLMKAEYRKMKRYVFILLVAVLPLMGWCVTPQVTAKLDSTTLFLGDQTDLHLQVTQQAGEIVQMPVYGEELVPGVEIVERTIVDTTQLEDGRVQIDQYLTLTSFKDSLFYIEPLPFVVNGDTIYSEGLSLNVIQPFEVDSANSITPIKDIYRAPVWWWGIIRWVLLGLLLAGLAVGGYYAWRKWGYLLGKKEDEPVSPELLRPAEEVALEKLDRIKQEKIWQEGRLKDYHTDLTDVVREYISRRFEVSSSEKTSDETLRAMKPILKEQRELFMSLSKMLQLADLVKFAKWTATPEENEQSLQQAYTFVNETTPVATPETETTNESNAEQL